MFPEGTRQSGPKVEELFDGTAYVAAKTGVPIIPMGIGGSEAMLPKGAKLPRRSKLVLVVGEPIPAPAKTESGRRSEEHTSELQSLMRISYAVFCLRQKIRSNRDTSVRTR